MDSNQDAGREAELRFQGVQIRAFRNLDRVELEPGPRLNVIAGDNGHGKTSLLEALYVVATTKSFRTQRLGELVQQGSELATVAVRVVEAGLEREQRAAIGERARGFTIDGKRAARRVGYAVRTPVVVFHPADLLLISGPAAPRRTLLDRIGLFLDPGSADHRQRYLEAMRERQRALEVRGTMAAELDAYETLQATHGAAVERVRARAADRLIEALAPAFARMAAPGLSLTARFVPGGPDEERELGAALAAHRAADLRRGAALIGPHRDDFETELDGRSTRRHASQGQQRILSLALKLAELDCVRAARGAHPVLLLDDASSELDPARTGALTAVLTACPSQIFVTTTRPELFDSAFATAGARVDWTVRRGVVERA